MAGEELHMVRLKDEFYQDGFLKILIALVMVFAGVMSLSALSLYLHFSKPEPVYFATDNEWRVLSPVPLGQPYLTKEDLLQWVSTVFPIAFSYDFLNYKSQQAHAKPYFTANGWQNLAGQLNNYRADYNSLQNEKAFVNAVLTGAPFILSQGVLPGGKYAWRVQIPMSLNYSRGVTHNLAVIALIVRVPTLNDLNGVGIDDMNITETQGNQVETNG